MGPLRVRRADRAPGIGDVEYFGKGPGSLIRDKDCSLPARAAYVAITLAIAEDRAISPFPDLYLRTMTDLASDLGLQVRQARNLVAELEARGHVARERVRQISGSPCAIRILARFRGARTRQSFTGCTRQDSTGQPATKGTAPGEISPPTRQSFAGPFPIAESIESEDKEIEQQHGGCAAVVASSSSTGEGEEETATDARPDAGAFLGTLIFDLADAMSLGDEAKQKPRGNRRARKSPGDRTGKSAPGAANGVSIPDASNCTGQPGDPSRPEITKGT